MFPQGKPQEHTQVLQPWPKCARLHLELAVKFGDDIHICKTEEEEIIEICARIAEIP